MAALPNTVVIGAQRAGTTMLLGALAEHPEVEAATGGEFHGFQDPGYSAQTVTRIASRFHRADAPRRVFKCASYLAQPEVPARLAADLDTPDIVVILRDPVARAISAWYWHVYIGVVPVESPESGLRRLLAGEVRGRSWRGGDERRILDWGFYHRLLGPWLSVFPREKVQIVTDLDLRRDALETFRNLYQSLGIDPSHRPTSPDRHHNRSVHSLRRLRWLSLRNRWSWAQDPAGQWFAASPTTFWGLLGNAAVQMVDRAVLAPFDAGTPPQLSSALETALSLYYEEDTRRLEALLGVDLRAWRRYEAS